jgi:uncharacterized protein (DUF849 family)
MSKVIVSCAITGAVHTPSMSPYPPVTPQEIADQSATIAHLHARDPINGAIGARADQRQASEKRTTRF